ncbi:hypothetical protein AWENTII_012545 [Aspergillus wentii]
MTVINNSRSESGPGSGSFIQSQTQTPIKTPRQGSGLFTPQTNTNERRIPDIPPLKPNTPSSSAKAKMMSEDMEDFEWDEELDDEVNQILERPSQRQQQPDFSQEASRKTSLPRTPCFTTPGKRKLEDMEESEGTLTPPQSNKRSTASTSFSSFSFSGSQSQPSRPPPVSPEPSLASTPTRLSSSGTIFSPSSSADTPSLSRQVLSLLQSHKVVLPRAVQDELTALVDRHDLRTQGIVRGRDISRVSLRKRDEQIMKLNERIASLESQREMDRALIDGLRGYDKRT